MTAALQLHGLVAGYGGVPVVHGVDLHVDHGEVVALLGPNGAGKTTLLLAVSGLVSTLDGDIEVLGEVVRQRRRARPADVARQSRRGVAHVSEDRALFADLTAAENLRLAVSPRRQRRHRGRRTSSTKGRVAQPVAMGPVAMGPVAIDPVTVDEVMTWFPALARVSSRRAGLLSGGEQQMLALARAVVSDPQLLLVDEMSLGLAPVIVEQLLPTLRTVARRTGAGVLVVEQHVGLALSVADRAYLLARGQVLASGSGAAMASNDALLEAGYLGGAPSRGVTTAPSGPATPADPGGPGGPGDPVDHVEPVDPVDPVDPAEPPGPVGQ
jgi:branched-chain amino acid transport system ATP-binding protein